MGSFFAAGKTTFHAAAAEEDRNAAFDAGAKALCFFEIRAFLKGLTRGSFLSAALGNAGARDTGLAASLMVIGAIKATIGGEDFGIR